MAVKESQLADSQFAFVLVRDGKKVRKERIDDAGHVRNAIARFRQVKDVSDAERDRAWARILRKAKRYGVNVSEESWHDLKARMVVRARSASVELPVTNAPNRTPFTGILCVLDEPSTRPPEGADGKCVILSRELAERLVPTLIGQAVDWKPTLDGHDTQCKVGVITSARVFDHPEIGKPVIEVGGILYDQDFPELVPAIRKHVNEVGMSFELGAELGDGPTEETAQILDSNGFTGAAILLRKDAAYHKTRLAAGREKERKGAMSITKEDLTAALAASIGGLKSEIMAEVKTLVQAAGKKKSGKERLADDLEAAREHAEKANDLHADMVKKVTEYDPDGDESGEMLDGMQAAGKKLGDHLKAAHKHLKSMKADDYMDAAAEKGDGGESNVKGAADPKPAADSKEIADLKAQVESLTTRLNGQSRENGEPARKTFSPEITALIAKGDVKLKDGEEPTSAQVRAALDTAKITDPTTRVAALMQTKD